MKLLLADDHPLFRAGIKQAITNCPDCQIIGEAETGEEALKKIQKLKPDVAILDIRMPEKSGLEVAEEIYRSNQSTKIILLTMHKNSSYLYKAISVGVKAYLSKEDAVQEIVRAIENVAKGKSYISSSLSGILSGKSKSGDEVKQNISAISSLTAMERRVLKLIAEWKSNEEIGEALFISPRTAGNHRTNISAKLNLRGTHGLIKFAIENKDLF